jgi:hypothetical protein
MFEVLVIMENTCIVESENMKFPSLQIDNNLSWTNHIDKLIPKRSILCRDLCFISATLTLLISLFCPFLLYNEVWKILGVIHLTEKRYYSIRD